MSRCPAGISETTSLQRCPDVAKPCRKTTGSPAPRVPGCIVVESRAGEIDELTAHGAVIEGAGGRT